MSLLTPPETGIACEKSSENSKEENPEQCSKNKSYLLRDLHYSFLLDGLDKRIYPERIRIKRQ